MRKLLLLFLNFLLVVSSAGEELGDSISKRRTRELNINSSLVIPVYYNFRFREFGHNYINSEPDFKLSASFGIQYKTRHNLLFEFRFQHFQFSYTSPIYGYTITDKYGSSYSRHYYDILNYGHYRSAFGLGKHIKINNKNVLGISIGFALFSPDHKNEYTSTYSESGTLYSKRVTKNSFYALSVYYCNIRYSHSLNKRISLFADIDQSLSLNRNGSWPEFPNLSLKNQYLLSLNIGVKYTLINQFTR